MNHHDKTTKYINDLKNVKLSDSSRARIETNLLEYARFHSVKEGVRIREDSRYIKQVPPGTSLFNLFKQPQSMTAAIIAIVLLAGGGTSFAAEAAVPGDFLYPVKTEVNENIKSAFAISAEAEAKLQARLAEERLEEAEELSARGELTAEHATELGLRIKAHTDAAKEHGVKAGTDEQNDSVMEIRSSLEGAFRTHADVLNDLNLNVSGDNGILDVNIGSHTDADATVEGDTTTETDSNTNDENATSSVEIDAAIDGAVDTDVIDADLETDTAVDSSLSL